MLEKRCSEIIRLLEDKQAKDIRKLTVNSSFAAYFIIATALSHRHLKSLSEEIETVCKKAHLRPIVQGKREETGWVVVDAGGIFVHLFLEEGRLHYQLEKLWQGS